MRLPGACLDAWAHRRRRASAPGRHAGRMKSRKYSNKGVENVRWAERSLVEVLVYAV